MLPWLWQGDQIPLPYIRYILHLCGGVTASKRSWSCFGCSEPLGAALARWLSHMLIVWYIIAYKIMIAAECWKHPFNANVVCHIYIYRWTFCCVVLCRRVDWGGGRSASPLHSGCIQGLNSDTGTVQSNVWHVHVEPFRPFIVIMSCSLVCHLLLVFFLSGIVFVDSYLLCWSLFVFAWSLFFWTSLPSKAAGKTICRVLIAMLFCVFFGNWQWNPYIAA